MASGGFMGRSNPELWQRLAEFEVSRPGGVFSFTGRLARENRWPLEFAHRVFDEYRRFLYLSVVVGHQLTPPEAVGRTWRLHLSYPTSYGQALCRAVLGQRLRPELPEAGVEPGRREASYRATLAAYEQEFGGAPPAEIWPAPERRPAGKAPVSAPRPKRVAAKGRKLARAPLMPAAGPP